MWTTTFKSYEPFALGLDDVFNRLDSMTGHNVNYPPYNTFKDKDGNYTIEIALAGFKKDEIEVSTEQNVLSVTSKITKPNTERSYIHQGLSKRSFSRTFQLGEELRVSSVNFEDGLLTIRLDKVIPEHQRKKLYEITSPMLLTE